MKTQRIKPQPLKTRAEFLEQVSALLTLEAQKRKIDAERDVELLKINAAFDVRLAPVEAEIKGRMALAADYAEEHATELLPDKAARSFATETARIGWRRGNRTVGQKSGVSVEQAVRALEALGLDAYVKIEKGINRAAILTDCTDNKTLRRPARDSAGEFVMENGEPKFVAVPLSDAGLKITQGESFYIEPKSESGETLTPASAAA